MHISLPILAGHVIMGTDAPESMGFKLNQGNSVYINLEPDTRAETDRLFKALAEGGTVEMQLAEQFWGDYFGSLKDKFGTQWMFNCRSKTSGADPGPERFTEPKRRFAEFARAPTCRRRPAAASVRSHPSRKTPMSTVLPASAPATIAAAPPRTRSTTSQFLETAGRWTNRLVGGAALAQFYSAGLAVFGVASFSAHQRVGWLVQLTSLLTMVLLLAARVPFRVSRLAILLFFLGVLQPVLAFAVRATAPWLSALHPVNGVVMLAVCLLLERRLRR